MSFQTPKNGLDWYLERTTNGVIQLPDFQRGYKWDDDRIRELLVTVLRGHPMGVVMLLQTGNDQIRFKPRSIEGVMLPEEVEPQWLLLDGQQRLTSLTQALTGSGVVDTKDSRGKHLKRRYYIDMELAIQGDERLDEAVISVPGDGIETANFGKDIIRDLSTPEKEQLKRLFPFRQLFGDSTSWLLDMGNPELHKAFHNEVIKPVSTYAIPAIELDKRTNKSAVATVFEKVNTGGLSLNVFELLTATFAGDRAYFEQHGSDFRLNDDWEETKHKFSSHPVLSGVENTDFLQAITLLATRKRNLEHGGHRPPAISAKREDVLKLTLSDYLEWVGPLREGFVWAANFLADLHVFDARFLPYPKQLVPLAAIRVVLGNDADLISHRERLVRWFWCGIMGELYGGASETRFVRDLDQVPDWVRQIDGAATPNTVNDATFVESRLHSLRTRQAAAYKGLYALLLGNGARDWMEDKAFDKVQYTSLAVDIHHIFPKKWCHDNGIESEQRESIVNKTPLSARTNRTIGGSAPSVYLRAIESKAQIGSIQLNGLLSTHLVSGDSLRRDDFQAFFQLRREALCQLVENAMGKSVPRDIDRGEALEDSSQFDLSEIEESADEVESTGEILDQVAD